MSKSGIPKLSLSIIEDLKGKGYSQADIARMYGVTRQYVTWIKNYYGGRKTPKELVLEHFPWKVSASQSQTSPYRRMRDHAEYVATGGVGMTDDALKRLETFYQKLKEGDFVLEFDPDLPPEPGVSSRGGWAFRKRQESDGDLMIRVNEHTTLTDQGRIYWRIPKIMPLSIMRKPRNAN